ncbi:SDR family NAD(P)-dependent oxidoreductase [Azospirillum isscasi]|uniref:SDR family NAD(P)-dependent oxidoreductase n=1 Tax=Azospirillum isscasi TaxID=3053926 RepID=A0ABU0WK98_9PROT|nr:SDR family NAD(P)-dependent oxidoreductase [Azospirillum isscasi]MDQ2104537.1 SDR family NAD(P)-dependent oxidoreductase [Azospirillum isscasi]
MRDPRSIVITGASSGIGEELARAYAAPGVTLALTGRDALRLEAVAERCRAAGAVVETALVDVADRDAMAAWLTALDARAPVDLVIANAGISAGTGGGTESAEQARRIFQVNVDGVLNSVHPLLPGMQARRRGQIALMASLAGFRGMPGAPAYCASKAAVRDYGESLRGDLEGQGIGVTVICPGFVKSRMTAVNRFPMPFLMETDRAARVIKNGLARNRARIAFPWPMAAAVWLLAALPAGWTDALLRRAPRKR